MSFWANLVLSIRRLQGSGVDGPIPLLLAEVPQLRLEFRVPLDILVFHGRCLFFMTLELLLQPCDLVLVLPQFVVLAYRR